MRNCGSCRNSIGKNMGFRDSDERIMIAIMLLVSK